MGINDQITYTLTCQKCAQVEKKKVLDKGSSFGGSSWQSGVVFSEFDVTWTRGGIYEPSIAKTLCKKCDIAANISSTY